MKRLFIPLTITLCAWPLAAQTKLTFDGALRRALEVNNPVERAREDVGIAQEQRNFLLSAVLPRITISGDLTRNSIEQRFGE